MLGGRLTRERGTAALEDYAELALERHPHLLLLLLARAWELRNSVSAHDAQSVALAELLDVPLVTGDERLSRAPGLRCAVDLLR